MPTWWRPSTGTQLYDNGSGNGTFVNGIRIDAVTLRVGDVITIGNTDLIFTGGTVGDAADGGDREDRRCPGPSTRPSPSTATSR